MATQAIPFTSSITRTNLGPLTTNTWTHTCTEVIQACGNCNFGWAAQTCTNGAVSDNQECWPPRATDVPETSDAVFGWGVYSPGIVCPGGYTSVATAIYGSSNFDFQFPLLASETAIGCCPTGSFSAIRDGYDHQTCLQSKPKTSFLVGSCGAAGPTYTPFSVGGELNSTKYNNFLVNAPFLQLVYHASDLPATSTSSSTRSSSSSSTSSTSTRSPTSPVSEQSPDGSQTSGLSPGAAAGIAVGAVLGVIFAATAVFCLWRARRRRKAAAARPQDGEFVPPEFKPFGPVGIGAQSHNNIEPTVAPQWRYDGAVWPGVVGVNPNHPAELENPILPAELESSAAR